MQSVAFPQSTACEAPTDNDFVASVNDAEKRSWNACELWVWSCLRQGREANLFTKQCRVARTEEMKSDRDAFKYWVFARPTDYAGTNYLRDSFLTDILSKPHYSSQIASTGVRIFGGYFAEHVNLENVTTEHNVVLDGSIIRRGLRLTNFATKKNLSVDGSNIRGTFDLKRARIDGSVFMEFGVYDVVDLRDARIGASVEATGSIVNSIFQFDRASIAGKLALMQSRLTWLKGWESEIGGSLQMRLADVRLKIDLTGARVNGDVLMQDVTFGTQNGEGSEKEQFACTWDLTPDTGAQFVLSKVSSVLKNDHAFTLAVAETVDTRPGFPNQPTSNPCMPASGKLAPNTLLKEALLRDMRINGMLCIVNVSGAVDDGTPGARLTSIESITLDGLSSKSAFFSWVGAESITRWRAVNFSTGALIIDLNAQPYSHYIDNLSISSIAFARPDEVAKSEDFDGIAESDLVKHKCDPATASVENADARETQKRIEAFFVNDQSNSSQPFRMAVDRLTSAGVKTLPLRKALSEYERRSACAQSLFAQSLRSSRATGVGSLRDAYRGAVATFDGFDDAVKEAAKVGLDGGCTVIHQVQKQLVYYGHETWRLAAAAVIAVLLFAGLLRFDRRTESQTFVQERMGIVYAIDSLIPLRPYRINPVASDERPNSRWLRAWGYAHRLFGLLLLFLFIFYVYLAPK